MDLLVILSLYRTMRFNFNCTWSFIAIKINLFYFKVDVNLIWIPKMSKRIVHRLLVKLVACCINENGWVGKVSYLQKFAVNKIQSILFISTYPIWTSLFAQTEIPIHPANCPVFQIFDDVLCIWLTTTPITQNWAFFFPRKKCKSSIACLICGISLVVE